MAVAGRTWKRINYVAFNIFFTNLMLPGASSAWRSDRALSQAACPEVQLWQDDLQVNAKLFSNLRKFYHNADDELINI